MSSCTDIIFMMHWSYEIIPLSFITLILEIYQSIPIIHRIKSRPLSLQENPVHFGLHSLLKRVPDSTVPSPIQIRFFTSTSQTPTSLFFLSLSLQRASCSSFSHGDLLFTFPETQMPSSLEKIPCCPSQCYLQCSPSDCLVGSSLPRVYKAVLWWCVSLSFPADYTVNSPGQGSCLFYLYRPGA